MKFLNDVLKHEIDTGEVEVHMDSRGLVISLHEGAFFGSGDDTIIPGSYPSVAKIADVIRPFPIPCASKDTPMQYRSIPPVLTAIGNFPRHAVSPC